MDPDQTLLEAQEFLAEARRALNRGDRTAEVTLLRQAAQSFEDLDRWLRTGGFPPALWVAPIPVNEGRQ